MKRSSAVLPFSKVFVAASCVLVAVGTGGCDPPPSFISLVAADGSVTPVEHLVDPNGLDVAADNLASHPGGFVVAGMASRASFRCVFCPDNTSSHLLVGAFDADGALRWTMSGIPADSPNFAEIISLATTTGGNTLLAGIITFGSMNVELDGDAVELPASFLVIIDDDGRVIGVKENRARTMASLLDGAMLIESTPDEFGSIDEVVHIDAFGNELERTRLDADDRLPLLEDVQARGDGAAVALMSRTESGDDADALRADTVVAEPLRVERGRALTSMSRGISGARLALVEDGGFIVASPDADDGEGSARFTLGLERRAPGEGQLWRRELPPQIDGDALRIGVIAESIVMTATFLGEESEVEGQTLRGPGMVTLVFSLQDGSLQKALSGRSKPSGSFRPQSLVVVGNRAAVAGSYDPQRDPS